MKREQFERLFEGLAMMSPALDNVCERALDTVRDDESLSRKTKESVITSVKALLFHSSELKDYVAEQYSDLDFINDGSKKFDQIKAKTKLYIAKETGLKT